MTHSADGKNLNFQRHSMISVLIRSHQTHSYRKLQCLTLEDIASFHLHSAHTVPQILNFLDSEVTAVRKNTFSRGRGEVSLTLITNVTNTVSVCEDVGGVENFVSCEMSSDALVKRRANARPTLAFNFSGTGTEKLEDQD